MGNDDERNVVIVEDDNSEDVKKVEVTTTDKKDDVPKKVTEIKKEENNTTKKSFNFGWFREVYDKHYKILLIFPILLLVLSLVQIGYQTMSTGDFIHKGVSLKGGITVTVDYGKDVDINLIQEKLNAVFTDHEVEVRRLESAGQQIGIIAGADIDINEKETVDAFILEIGKTLNEPLTEDDYSIEFIGSSLGASFFNETFKALIIAFISMALIVFLYFSEHFLSKVIAFILAILIIFSVVSTSGWIYWILFVVLGALLLGVFFRYSIPSIAVVLAAFSTLTMTVAAFNILGFKIGTAGISALLMLIGYSVDTDILLSTRVLKRKEGSVFERTLGALKTGIMMTLTALAAVIAALLFTKSDVMQQIMLILFIGLLADMINTWIQNAGILRWYLEKHEPKN